MLNKLTDDDTGGKPLGDLLVNKTKYEMGDAAYNALSDSEKKNHCDILTLLMQGNGQAVQLMETELTKAADARKTTWLNKFLETNLDSMTEKLEEENPNLTPSEINSKLDKLYGDDAKKILAKWSTFGDELANYKKANKSIKEVIKSDKEVIEITENSTDEDVQKAVDNTYKAEADLVKGGAAAEDVVVHDYLNATQYGDGTLLDFFERDKSEFDDKDTIRELYPIVASLSGGQLAGLDFISLKDMILMAITDENGFKNAKMENNAIASIYQDVNREIYDRGGVALTDDALRAKANAQEAKSSFELSNLGIVLWSCTAAAGFAAAGTAIGWAKVKPQALHAHTNFDSFADKAKQLNALGVRKSSALNQLQNYDTYGIKALNKQNTLDLKGLDKEAARATLVKKVEDAKTNIQQFLSENGYENESQFYKAHREAFEESRKTIAVKSPICKYLTIGFTIVTAILAGYSIYNTIKEMMAYYKVTFAPIPKYMVERTDISGTNAKGDPIMIRNQTAYYKVVSCNRTEGDSSVEKENYKILGDRSDLNGDVGQQWLALYSVKYENGLPILADSLKLKMGDGDAPKGYTTGIHMFGDTVPWNLTYPKYAYNDPYDGTYVYFKNDTATVKDQTAGASTTGSFFSGNSLAIGAVVGLVIGIAGVIVINKVKNRKKKKTAA